MKTVKVFCDSIKEGFQTANAKFKVSGSTNRNGFETSRSSVAVSGLFFVSRV